MFLIPEGRYPPRGGDRGTNDKTYNGPVHGRVMAWPCIIGLDSEPLKKIQFMIERFFLFEPLTGTGRAKNHPAATSGLDVLGQFLQILDRVGT